MWTPEVIRPVVSITGSHQKTCLFGALCIDGRQFFSQQYLQSRHVSAIPEKITKEV